MFKSTMRLLSTLVLATLVSAPAMATDLGDLIRVIGGFDHSQPGRDWDHGRGGGWDRGPGGGYGRNLRCTAQDRGWEEHFSGHGSCGECLSQHGQCIETCEQVTEIFTVSVDGRNRMGGYQTFTAEARDPRMAERLAYENCNRSGFADCRYARTDRRQARDVVSRQDCRRGFRR